MSEASKNIQMEEVALKDEDRTEDVDKNGDDNEDEEAGGEADPPMDPRAQKTLHFGETGFDMDDPRADPEDITWGQMCRACCCHSAAEWFGIFVGIVIVCGMLYFFLLGLELLGTSAKALTGCTAAGLFGNTNPVASVIIGMLVTVLLQSSSTTTSIIVSLVSSGLDVRAAIYMVMGANIGTSVTNTIVAMGQLGDGDELERAFAGATVHDMFNFLSVAILLPVEAATGYLFYLTEALTPSEVADGESWKSPFKTMLDPIVNLLIVENKNLMKDVANGVTTCPDSYYPIYCSDGIESYDTCKEDLENDPRRKGFGLIACDKGSGKCPAFFQNGASQSEDMTSAGACLFISLVILIAALLGLVWILKKMLLGASQKVIVKATSLNGYLSMLIGALITVMVQSSSVTTSTLTPLVGLGVLPVEQMYPLTLGANIGTTVTGFMAASVSGSTDSLQVALSHLFFNITGIIIWYPIPFLRRIPIGAARALGHFTRIWKGFPLLYIAVAFFLIPIIILGLSYMFQSPSLGVLVFGIILLIFIIGFLLQLFRWWIWQDGRNKTEMCFSARQRRQEHTKALPENMDYVMSEVKRLKDFTGMPEEEETEALIQKKGGDTVEDDAAEDNPAEPTTRAGKAWANMTRGVRSAADKTNKKLTLILHGGEESVLELDNGKDRDSEETTPNNNV